MRPYRQLTPAARNAALDAYGALFDAACEARLDGWRSHEADAVVAAARRLDVTLWPTYIGLILKDARHAVPRGI